MWEQQEEAPGQTLEQMWFAGVHSDVGGGYAEPDLAEIPLLWMAERARDTGLAFDPEHLQPSTPPVDPERRALGAQIAPDPLGPIHESRKGFYLLLPRHRRPLAADGGAVAPSAVVRRRERDDYSPANLDEYLASVKSVPEGPPAPRRA